MKRQFRKHYTREEARALLPQVQQWLTLLRDVRDRLDRFDKRLGSMLAAGDDVGGETANGWVRSMSEFRRLMREFEMREILVKDLDRGLLDFPAIMKGREVLLCWELGEEDIEFWHDLDSGYAGRERLHEE
jgi:hypothetical protein